MNQSIIRIIHFFKGVPITIGMGGFLLLFFLSYSVSAQQQRFPKPEFETGYTQPTPTTPEVRATGFEYLDVAVLLLVMSLAAWLGLRKRSRKGILWLSVFSLLYFGFYREGCVCSIGAIQNVTLTLFDPAYAISIPILLFFLLPLLFSLFFGRVFCAAACPLGAIQDLVIIKPITLPAWLNKALGFIPYIYLGLAVLMAATASDFIICRFDPFVGFFRMGAEFTMILLGVAFLLMGLFVARPYCRFLCPYGVLLGWMSRFSKFHLSITPAECIQCKLCEHSCPFDVIDTPTEALKEEEKETNKRRFTLFALLIPVWIFIGGYALSLAHPFLSKAHPDVYLAELLITRPELKDDPDHLDVQTFLASGKPMEQLVDEAKIIRKQYHKGSWILGGFLGLVIGLMLMNQFVLRRRDDYTPNKTGCYSCGRCMNYCPVPKK
ncbi:4Fe-4S binding protein [Roseimarinus sediminis]|uniref:4Fe-4S binding protein n=1 Tax=Roseimarinus sediminis TaxID=1610899 RepID=UPI003D23091E